MELLLATVALRHLTWGPRHITNERIDVCDNLQAYSIRWFDYLSEGFSVNLKTPPGQEIQFFFFQLPSAGLWNIISIAVKD